MERRRFCNLRSYLFAFGTFLVLFKAFTLNRKEYSFHSNFTFETATPKRLSEGHPKHEKKRITLEKLKKVLIDDYITWHALTVASVKRGDIEAPKTVIFRGNEGRHGLGDRIRGIIHAYFCALFSDRLFLIVWDEPFRLSDIFGNGLHSNFTYDETYFGPGHSKSSYKKVVRSELSDISVALSSKQTLFFDVETMPNLDAVLEMPNIYPHLKVSKKLASIYPMSIRPKPFEFYPLLFRELFATSKKFKSIIRRTKLDLGDGYHMRNVGKSQVFGKDLEKKYISIHARLGIGLGEYEKRFNLLKKGLTIQNTAKCIAREANKLSKLNQKGEEVNFFLATDTVLFRKILASELRALNNESKLFHGSWKVKHIKHIKRSAQTDTDFYMNTFLDLYFLSKGNSILYIDSGFANLAMWMGSIGNSKKFDFQACYERITREKVSRKD